ncbi:MAG: SLC13 family permease [Peptoniphilaceae bacterium]|nr:SLC13 family permease [Peptoniphilaceae bacterium]MDY6019534.1 SLC13 family permease [Anaerococcus sp.]
MLNKEKFSYDPKELRKIIFSLIIIAIFWIIPPISPITKAGMEVIGVFIGAVLLLSMVDIVWPVFFCFAILPLTGVVSINEVIAGSLGSWIITFVIASFIMTTALNKSGFTSRLTIYYMTRKFASKSPWLFTFSFYSIAMIIGMFMDQVPAAAFFLLFSKEVLSKIGYTKEDKYSHVLTMGSVFAVNIGGAMTPISHSLVMLGLGIFQEITGQTINLLTYMTYAVPVGLILFILLCFTVKVIIRPDIWKLDNFDVKTLIDKNKKEMGLVEKTTVVIFFATVLMWILPGILALFLPKDNALMSFLSQFSITFWAVVAVVLFAVIRINNEPILDLKETLENDFQWGVILFISIGVVLGSVVSNPGVGLNDFIIDKLNPLLTNTSTVLIVMILAFATLFLTNFASNVTTITVMTTVAVTLAKAGNTVDPVAIAITTTMCGSLAFILPSSFAPIAMLHSDEFSDKKMIITTGILMVVFSTVLTTFIGYNIVS